MRRMRYFGARDSGPSLAAARACAATTTSSAARARVRDQRGETLLGAVIALLILAIVGTASLSILFTTMKIAMTHKAIVRTTNEATIAAEYIERMPYQPCDNSAGTTHPTGQDYMDVMFSSTDPYINPQGLDLDLTVKNVEFLSDDQPSTASFSDTCPMDGDLGLQQITVRVVGTGGGGPLAADLVFLKRDASCDGLAEAEEGQVC